MKVPNLNGWGKLICPYFAPTCRSILGQYLEDNGFTEIGLNEVGGVRFARLGIFLEVSYELEIVPQALNVVIGIGDRKYDADGHPCCVPYWYFAPSEGSVNFVTHSKFKTEFELEAVLSTLKNAFLEPCAKRLWTNQGQLETAIRDFRSKFDC